MTDQIVLKQLIRFVAMSSTATELGNIGMRSVVKVVCSIVETNENNVRRLNSPFFNAEVTRVVLSMLRCS